jgi:hypothetical protein
VLRAVILPRLLGIDPRPYTPKAEDPPFRMLPIARAKRASRNECRQHQSGSAILGDNLGSTERFDDPRRRPQGGVSGRRRGHTVDGAALAYPSISDGTMVRFVRRRVLRTLFTVVASSQERFARPRPPAVGNVVVSPAWTCRTPSPPHVTAPFEASTMLPATTWATPQASTDSTQEHGGQATARRHKRLSPTATRRGERRGRRRRAGRPGAGISMVLGRFRASRVVAVPQDHRATTGAGPFPRSKGVSHSLLVLVPRLHQKTSMQWRWFSA